jgi:PKD repeat protein
VANPNNGPTITVSFSVVDGPCSNFNASVQSQTNPGTCGGSNGSITVATTNATAPVNYVWSHNNALNSATASGLTAGSYTVTVTDANNCSKVLTVTLTDPANPVVTLANFSQVETTAPAFTLTGGSPAGGSYGGTGVSGNQFNPAVAGVGSHPITYTYTDPVTGCSNSAVKNINVVLPGTGSALIVLDANTDTPLYNLTNGLQIQKSAIGNTPLGIIFNPDLNPNGVSFKLTGPINETRAEGSSPPYSLFGDIGVNVQGKPFPVGNYTLVANPNNGPTITVSFSVVDGPQPPNAVASGTADPNVSLRVNFSSNGSTAFGGASIVSYLWNYGDNTTSAAQHPSHDYAAPGNYTVALEVTDSNGAKGNTSINVEAVDLSAVDRVVSFVLIDAVADDDIVEISNNDVITGTGINIRANTSPSLVGSVKFALTGPVSRNWTESVDPYALYADVNGDYNAVNLPNGSYTLTATPYSLGNGGGVAGMPLTVNFTVGQASTAKQQVNTMQIHPNPADREVTMAFDKEVQINEVQVYDVTGRLVKTIKASDGPDLNSYLLGVQDLPSATYFVRIKDSKGQEYQKQMLIKR